jgi:hypothetical protein
MNLLREDLEARLPEQFKASTEVLNLRKMMENLGKQKKYKEAHVLQAKAQAMEQQ